MPGAELNVLVAVAAGLLSFLSPCVLPLLPSYLSFIAGISFEELQGTVANPRTRRALFVNSVLFVVGFSLVFIALGAGATLAGQVLFQYQVLIRRVGGALVVLMGLYVAGLAPHSVPDAGMARGADQSAGGVSRRRADGHHVCRRLDALYRADPGIHPDVGLGDPDRRHRYSHAGGVFAGAGDSLSPQLAHDRPVPALLRSVQALLPGGHAAERDHSDRGGALALDRLLRRVLSRLAFSLTPDWLFAIERSLLK